MKRLIGAAAAAIALVFASAGAAGAATVYDQWQYSYGPSNYDDQVNYPATGTPVNKTISSRPAILDAAFWFRLDNFTIDTVRITNATPGDAVRIGLGNHVIGDDYLGFVGADGTFDWTGSFTPIQGKYNYTFFHLIVSPLKDGRMDFASRFDLDQLTFSGTIPGIVPEPATWAMMIIGFGAVGSAVRVSRRRNALSAA